MLDYTYKIINIADPSNEELNDITEQMGSAALANEIIKKIKVSTAYGDMFVMGFASYLLNEKDNTVQMPTLSAIIKQQIDAKHGIYPNEEETEE